jgi:glycosyltransferase involved in cell wall biosynthesis
VIQAYAARRPGKVTCLSEPDRGQADAINKGLRRASGAILAFLNSDDTYQPEAVATVVNFLSRNPSVGLVHGRGLHISAEGRPLSPYPSSPCDHHRLADNCPVCQPTAFWRREVWASTGEFDTALRYTMDYDYWIRATRRFSMAYMDAHLANTRLHADAKTVFHRLDAHREIAYLVKTHYGRVSDHWIFAYAHALPCIDRLRTGRLLPSLLYVPMFVMASMVLFLKFNRRVPRSAVIRFMKSLPSFRTAGRLSFPDDHA